MNYVVIGAGGTGGSIGGFLAKAKKNVTLIARGEHLQSMRANGLCFETPDGTFSVPVRACTMEEYTEVPDVVFVCVKGYSLDDAIAFIGRAASPRTVVIPILNIYGTGGAIQAALPDIPVMDGCIYIAAEIKKPGTILMSGKIFRVVCGLRKDASETVRAKVTPVLAAVAGDLADAGIDFVISGCIEKDALQKFSFVSPMAALGACHNITASAMQPGGAMRGAFITLVGEIKALSEAMGVALPDDIVEINLKIMDDLAPGATASMQRDIRAKKQSEADGLVYQVVRLGRQYHVPTPAYADIADRLKQVI